MKKCDTDNNHVTLSEPVAHESHERCSLSNYLEHTTRHEHRLIFQLTQRGFTSELNNLLLALLYCLENNIEFRLSSRYWGAAHAHGWTDYFSPFCKESNNPFTKIGTIARLPKKIERRQKLYKIFRPKTLFTHDIWQAVQNPAFLNRSFNFPQLGISGDIFHAKRILLTHIYQLNPSSIKAIEQLAVPAPKAYAAFHIRRGDKLVSEAKAIKVDAYIAELSRARADIKDVYLATDDYSVVTEMKLKYPEYTIHTLCPESQRGYSQSNFNTVNAIQKKTETLRLLADIHHIRGAQFFIGTFSSNIGRFVALFKGLENCSSLDEEWYPL